MLIREIITEEYSNEMLDVIEDLLSMLDSTGVEEVSTEEFRSLLADQGYNLSVEALISALAQSGYADSADEENIVLTPPSTDNEEDPTLDFDEPEEDDTVSRMADKQASTDLGSEL